MEAALWQQKNWQKVWLIRAKNSRKRKSKTSYMKQIRMATVKLTTKSLLSTFSVFEYQQLHYFENNSLARRNFNLFDFSFSQLILCQSFKYRAYSPKFRMLTKCLFVSSFVLDFACLRRFIILERLELLLLPRLLKKNTKRNIIIKTRLI